MHYKISMLACTFPVPPLPYIRTTDTPGHVDMFSYCKQPPHLHPWSIPGSNVDGSIF